MQPIAKPHATRSFGLVERSGPDRKAGVFLCHFFLKSRFYMPQLCSVALNVFRLPCEKIRGFWPRNRVLARNPPASEGKGHPPAAKAQVGEIDARQNVANRARMRFGGHFRANSGHGTALWHGPASAGVRLKIATWPFAGNSLRGAPEPRFFVPERGSVAKNRAHANMEGRGARKGRKERRGEGRGAGGKGRSDQSGDR